MNFESLFSTYDFFVIIAIVIVSSIIKKFVSFKKLYVYIPFFVSLPIIAIFIIFKVIEVKDIFVNIVKYWSGAVLFYDAILEKFKNITIMTKMR